MAERWWLGLEWTPLGFSYFTEGMMAVNKEWRCAAHGPFEGTTGNCPYGCVGTARREIRTATGINTGMVRRVDATLGKFAKEYGLGDVSNRNGSVANSSGMNLQTADRFRRKPEDYAVEPALRDREHARRTQMDPYWLDLGDHDKHKETHPGGFVPVAENRLFSPEAVAAAHIPKNKPGFLTGASKLPPPKPALDSKKAPLEI